MRKILAIDIGGTFIKHAVMVSGRSFKITERNKIPTPKTNHEDLLNALNGLFKAYDDIEGIAVSMPGLIDTFKGVCISSGALNFSNGHCIAEELQNMCGVPATVENDANCAALAEIKSGSLTDVKNAFVLVFGTAVGGAFIHNRELYRGTHFCAGEVSFQLKNIYGAVTGENFLGNELGALAFQKNCAEILDMPPEEVTGEMIFDLIADNDDDMLDALYKYAHGVAAMIFNLQMLFDPERFALGGGISVQKIFIDAIQKKLDEISKEMLDYLPCPEIVACKHHNDANLLGALYRYLEK